MLFFSHFSLAEMLGVDRLDRVDRVDGVDGIDTVDTMALKFVAEILAGQKKRRFSVLVKALAVCFCSA
jgi:hypothetical protein